jgi:hypothetical protein
VFPIAALSDKQLVRRLASGDELYLMLLVDRHSSTGAHRPRHNLLSGRTRRGNFGIVLYRVRAHRHSPEMVI